MTRRSSLVARQPHASYQRPFLLYGILGHPLSHTLSPAMQQAALNARRIHAHYVAFDVPPAHLRRALQLLRRVGVAGLNVTVPHKERIMRELDGVDRAARLIGAVNTIVRRGTRLIGHNTDVQGLLEAWRRARLRLKGAAVLLVGAGGAARAVVWALHAAGAQDVAVANRTQRRAIALQRWARRCFPGVHVTIVSWRARATWMAQHQPACIINATSLGLHAGDQLPVPLTRASCATTVYDLAYRRPTIPPPVGPTKGRRSVTSRSPERRPPTGGGTTAWVATARRRGMLAHDGRSMLLYQGARAFALWTGQPAPVATMRSALERALRSS